MTFPQWAATKWKGYTSMSERTPADGDDNDIVSSSSKLELVVFKLTNVSTTMDATCIGVCSCVFILSMKVHVSYMNINIYYIVIIIM